MARFRRSKPITSLKQFRYVWGISLFPRFVHPRKIPDTIKHFYPRKRFQARLSITADDIQGILALNSTEAQKIMEEIKAKRYKSPFPFITVKDLARYMHVAQWHIHHYFVTNELYEHYEMRNRHIRKHH
jgi:hypothetical protein